MRFRSQCLNPNNECIVWRVWFSRAVLWLCSTQHNMCALKQLVLRSGWLEGGEKPSTKGRWERLSLSFFVSWITVAQHSEAQTTFAKDFLINFRLFHGKKKRKSVLPIPQLWHSLLMFPPLKAGVNLVSFLNSTLLIKARYPHCNMSSTTGR